jgi:hypothetical protein
MAVDMAVVMVVTSEVMVGWVEATVGTAVVSPVMVGLVEATVLISMVVSVSFTSNTL